jgi:hypothetical protein
MINYFQIQKLAAQYEVPEEIKLIKESFLI